MDYQAELKRMEESSNDGLFWSPNQGQHKVKALSEIEESEPFKDDSKPRKKLLLSVDGKEVTWTFPKGKKVTSVYGQLMGLGVKRGKILNEKFTILVLGEGQDIRYTILSD